MKVKVVGVAASLKSFAVFWPRPCIPYDPTIRPGLPHYMVVRPEAQAKITEALRSKRSEPMFVEAEFSDEDSHGMDGTITIYQVLELPTSKTCPPY